MSNTKAVLIFISFVLLCGLVFYGITVYDKHETRAQDISEQQLTYKKQNDSLALANAMIRESRDRLQDEINSLDEQKAVNHRYYTGKSRGDVSKSAPEQNKILIGLIEK
jgi:cell division protein FtsB